MMLMLRNVIVVIVLGHVHVATCTDFWSFATSDPVSR